MRNLKLPRLPAGWSPGAPLSRPPVPEAPPPAPRVLLTRRQFVKGVAVVLAALAAPVTGARRAWARARGRFFTGPETKTLEALVDRIIPPDADPGGRELGAVRYVERLLTAFDRPVPPIYAGGPFSGRNPFPDNDRGVPSRRRPRNAFRRFIPLTRVQEIRWRAEIYGSASRRAPGADFADAERGAQPGLQERYRDGLARVDAAAVAIAGAAFATLSAADQDRVLAELDRPGSLHNQSAFLDLVIGHTIEGCFSAPEYGGNRKRAGWQMIGLEGDVQPLGFSIFSRDANGYLERPDHPMSTPNPDEVVGGQLQPKPISSDSAAVQAQIATLAGLLGVDC